MINLYLHVILRISNMWTFIYSLVEHSYNEKHDNFFIFIVLQLIISHKE